MATRKLAQLLVAAAFIAFFGADCETTHSAAPAPTSGPASAPSPAPAATRTNPFVSVSGNQLLIRQRVNGVLSVSTIPWEIRGIAWAPYGEPATERPPGDPNNPRTFPIPDSILTKYAAKDIQMMFDANINTVRTYQPFDPAGTQGKAVLDLMHSKGIKVAMTVAVHMTDTAANAVAVVNTYKEHPAILLWIVGNELDLNCLYDQPCTTAKTDAAVAKVNELVDAVSNADDEHPVAVSLSGNTTTAFRNRFSDNADLFALNVYRGLSFGTLFTDWVDDDPFFIAEYGIDVWDAACGGRNELAQLQYLTKLTAEIQANSSAQQPSNKCIGGSPFEWNDEWWKNTDPPDQTCTNCGATCTTSPAAIVPNDNAAHHTYGSCWASGLPDRCGNEAWWGLVSAQRQPRAAYYELQFRYSNRNP